jgi:hypothetical protein
VLGPSPFALTIPTFKLRAVAAAAGRAPLGGPRESILAALVVSRLVIGALSGSQLTPSQRSARADHARTWIGTMALPPVPKAAAIRAIESTVKGDTEGLVTALSKVIDVTAPYLDRAARSEFELLARELREQDTRKFSL